MAALSREGSGEACQVPGWRLGPALAIGVLAVEMDQQSTERPNVFVVVPHHLEQRARLAPPQEVEVSGRDLPASDVAVATEPEELRFDGRQPRIRHPMPEHPTHDR